MKILQFQLRKVATFMAFFLLTSLSALQAQVNVQEGITIDSLVNEILLGGGIGAQNITYNGEPAEGLVVAQLGSFTVDSSAFPIAEGIVMGTGTATGIVGGIDFATSNLQDDPDLVAISGGFTMNNCAIIEFDFTATTDTFLIDYVFASTEYPGYTCSSFNDAFGIFLSGPGIDGPFINNAANLALIPGTDIPVSINSVNSGSPSSGNPAPCLDANPNFVEDSIYFFNNNPTLENSIAYPGHTHMLTAFASLIPGEEYHFKFAIANASDQALQSAVMMRKGSVSSGLVTSGLQINVNTDGINVAPEGLYIAGTFNYFVPEPMVALSDDVYSFTAQVPAYVNVTYKFFNGNGPDAAELVPDECGINGLMPDGSRHISMPGESLVLDPVCFGTCEVCASALTTENDGEAQRLGIFPNPSSGQFQVVPPIDGQARIQAFDIQGRLVLDKRAFVNANNAEVLELPAKGIFRVILQYDVNTALNYGATVVVQ